MSEAPKTATDAWRHQHLGRHLGHALRRFDGRVMELMAQDAAVPLALANLARQQQVTAAHVHITRHLPVRGDVGARPSELALAAGMSKQAMAKLVEQCAAWGLVHRERDARDARAQLVRFTAVGLEWVAAFERATVHAQAEFQAEVGAQVATVVAIGLEAYGAGLLLALPGKRRKAPRA